MSVTMASIAKQTGEDAASTDPAEKVTFAFNPESLRVSYSKPQPPQSSNNSESTVEANNVRLDITLFFDTTESGDDVRKGPGGNNGTSVLKSLASPVDGAPAPSVIFDWGTFRFIGTIETLTETLDYWSSEGIPLRASLQLSIAGQQLDKFVNETLSVARVSPPTSGWGTTEIATLGGDSGSTHDINAANEVENPRFPALDRLGKDIAKANEDIDAALEDVNENLEEANGAFGELDEALDKLTIGSDKTLGGGSGSGGGAGLSLGLSAGIGIKGAAGFKLGFSAGASVGFGFGASAGGGAGFGIGAGAGLGLGIGLDVGIGLGIGESGVSFSASTSGPAGSSTSGSGTSAVSAALSTVSVQGGVTSQTGYSGSAAVTSASSSAAATSGTLGPAQSASSGVLAVAGPTGVSTVRGASASGLAPSLEPSRITASIAAPVPADSKRALASLTAAQGAFAGLGVPQRRPARLDIAAIAAAPPSPAIGPNTVFDLLGRANGGAGPGTAIATMPRSVSAARAVRLT